MTAGRKFAPPRSRPPCRARWPCGVRRRPIRGLPEAWFGAYEFLLTFPLTNPRRLGKRPADFSMNSALVFLLQAAPVSHEPQLIDLDQTVFVQFGIFLLLAAVLYQFLWKPYLRVRGERVKKVEGYRQDAVKMDADAAERLAKAEIALNAARREGTGERAKARAEAQTREAAVLAEANAEAQKTLAAARARL